MNDMAEPKVSELLETALKAMEHKDISGALQYLLQAADIEPENVKIINQVARCYFILGEFERAVACWNLAMVTDPTDPAAEQSINDFNDLPFQFWLKRYREAVAELENRNYEKAGSLLSVLVAEQDGFVSLYQLLGLCHFAGSDIEAARLVWSRGLSLDISNQVLLKYLAMRRDEAVEGVPQTASRGSGIRSLKTAGWVLAACLGVVLLMQIGLSFYRHAGTAMLSSPDQKAGHRVSDSAAPRNAIIGKSTGAPKISFKEDSSEGDQYETEKEQEYYEKGYKAYLQGDWRTACNNLNVVVAMDTGNYINREALYYLAQSYYFRKNYGEAKEFFEKYLATFPDSEYCDDSLYYLGCTALGQKDTNAAKKAFTRLQEMSPRSGYFTTREYKSVMEPK